MNNVYYEEFIEGKYELSPQDYKNIENSKLTRGVKRFFEFCYVVWVKNDKKDCSSNLLSLEQFKNISRLTTSSEYYQLNEKYIKPYLKKATDVGFFCVDFQPFVKNGLVAGGEFLIKNKNLK